MVLAKGPWRRTFAVGRPWPLFIARPRPLAIVRTWPFAVGRPHKHVAFDCANAFALIGVELERGGHVRRAEGRQSLELQGDLAEALDVVHRQDRGDGRIVTARLG